MTGHTRIRWILGTLIAGCAHAPKVQPDARSGPDGQRSSARILLPNQSVTDDVSYADQDQTDWWRIELPGKPGVLSTQVRWDNGNADVNVDIFDGAGEPLSTSPPRGSKEKKVLTQIDRPGTFYIRVTAPGKEDATVYTLVANWDLPPPPPPPDRPIEDRPVKKRRNHEPHEPKPVAEKPPGDTVQGRIVSAYREGPQMVLYIDKGSAAGVRTGMTGSILSGATGEDPIDGGSFKIVGVPAPNRSIAKSSVHAVGKNNRVSINLGR